MHARINEMRNGAFKQRISQDEECKILNGKVDHQY